jgi:L-ascorbate metabolism protein UlaG (beta-lactamase superfamily)
MKIRWNGHSSFTITADDGTIIVTDPYQPGAFGGGIGYQQITDRPNIVTISHDHDDHNYTAGFKGAFDVVTGAKTVKGIAFRAVDVFHDANGGKERGKNRIFVFTVSGVTICHCGDLGHPLNDAQAKQIGKVDVLLLPVGGFYTIDHLQATDVVNKLKPAIVIPMHFKTDKCGFPIAEVSKFTQGKDRVRNVGADEIELVAGKLPGATEILVLNHRF